MSEIINFENANPWESPLPLNESLVNRPYPLEALPNGVLNAVREVEGFTKAPPAMIAASALSTLSLAIQQYVDVKRGEKLIAPTGLFMLTIAESGERKSSCDEYFLEAIKAYQSQQREEAKQLIVEHRADYQAWEAEKKGIIAKIQTLSKSGKSSNSEKEVLTRLETGEPIKPRVPNFLYGDATPEALAYNLHNQWPSGGVVSSEAGIVLGSHGMGSDSVMRNLSMLNELWSGSELKIDRRTTQSFTLKGARLTMGLMVQEATLRAFFDKAGDLARGSGFLARFLIACPQSTQGSRWYQEAPTNTPMLALFNSRITAILNEQTTLNENSELEPSVIEFKPEAKELWTKFYNDTEAQLAPAGELESIRDVASKAADNVARLACLFHVFEHGWNTPIKQEYVAMGACLVNWYLVESKRFMSEMITPIEQRHAVTLDGWLIKYCRENKVKEVERRTIQRCVNTSKLRNGHNLDNALLQLADLNRIAARVEGRKTTIVINPQLLKTGGENGAI